MDLRHGVVKFLQISIYPLRLGAGLHNTYMFFLAGVRGSLGGYNQF